MKKMMQNSKVSVFLRSKSAYYGSILNMSFSFERNYSSWCRANTKYHLQCYCFHTGKMLLNPCTIGGVKGGLSPTCSPRCVLFVRTTARPRFQYKLIFIHNKLRKLAKRSHTIRLWFVIALPSLFLKVKKLNNLRFELSSQLQGSISITLFLPIELTMGWWKGLVFRWPGFETKAMR